MVSEQEITNLRFAFDQLASVEVLVDFIVEAVRSSDNFEQFKETFIKHLQEVTLTPEVTEKTYLDKYERGFLLVCNERPNRPDIPDDYLRNDEGFPEIFDSHSEAMEALPKGFKFIKVVDLSERHGDKPTDSEIAGFVKQVEAEGLPHE